MKPRRILGLAVAIVVLTAACGAEAEQATTSSSTTVTATTTTTSTTTTTMPVPVEVDSVAMFPDEATLQDGTWAAIVFRQALDCIPEETDLLAGESVPCETPVLFEGEGPGALIGVEVPVWLIRWPVISYAESNGLTALGQIRQLPTLIQTTTETYVEDDGAISLSGPLPDLGAYSIETTDGETRFTVPLQPAPEVPLAELTGSWDTGDHLIRVDEGGSYELFEIQDGGEEETTGVFGFVALQDGLLVFVTSAQPGPCPGDTGVYFAEEIVSGIRLAPVDEPCEFRARAFAGDWSLSSAG